MMKNNKLMANLLLITTGLALFAALLTIVPMGAKEANILGYKSICSFTPVSTVICLFLANTLYGIRKKIVL